MIEVELPEKLEFLFSPSRYKVLHGGRGGGKSHGIAKALLILAAQRKHRILCARELQVSIKDSVHKLLSDQIEAMGLGEFYRITQTQILGVNGSEFIFSGLRHNSNSIKSAEGITIVWCEEAQCISEDSWAILIPTIRAPSSEIWVSFNPDLDTDPTYKRFVLNPPPGSCVVQINWADNPWLPKVLLDEKDYLYRVDTESADHVWGGKTRRNSAASVLRGRYTVESFEPGADWNGPYFGADWGFGVDPTAAVKLWISERVLYVEYEAYGIGIDLDDTPELFDSIPNARDYTMRADNSRPETISHMRRHGYTRILPCQKGPGSVEDGVEHLRSYERIVIHPRCQHTAEEARLWSYKVDRLTGDVLPVLKPGNDHLIDAARYALEPIIRAGKPTKQEPPPTRKRHDYDTKSRPVDRWKVI